MLIQGIRPEFFSAEWPQIFKQASFVFLAAAALLLLRHSGPRTRRADGRHVESCRLGDDFLTNSTSSNLSIGGFGVLLQ